MKTTTITNGTKKVIATQNSEGSKWHARLYVNNGETATLVAATFKTIKGVQNWAKRKLA